MPKMIMHIIVGLEFGGAELMLKRLLKSSSDSNKYRHSVISLTSVGPIGRELVAFGVVVEEIGIRSAIDLPLGFIKLCKTIRRLHPDIVQTWMYHADLLGGLAARIVGVRNIIWGIRATQIAEDNSRNTIIVRKICSWLSAWIPRKIICAADASRKYHEAIGYSPQHMAVVSNGFDLPYISDSLNEVCNVRALFGINNDDLIIGSVGRFNQVKDPKNFVQAAGLLAKKFKHVRFLMVGRDVDYANKLLVSWIENTGFKDRFILLGQRLDMNFCYEAMDIFCLHSSTEGFPNVVGEAMSFGVPCVVTDVGDAAYLVADTGIVVPAKDSTLLANGLARLLALSKHEIKNLGSKARERIATQFTMECSRKKFEAIYDDLLISRGP